MANIIKVPKRRANLTKLQSFVRLYFVERVFDELPQKGLLYGALKQGQNYVHILSLFGLNINQRSWSKRCPTLVGPTLKKLNN